MKVIGIGVMLQTESGTYLLQERDHNTSVNPGRIAPFGGGLDKGEDVYECALRELREELALELESEKLNDIGLFASRHEPGVYVQMFLVKGINKSILQLREGKSIVELHLKDALQDDMVTDFAKEVLRTL